MKRPTTIEHGGRTAHVTYHRAARAGIRRTYMRANSLNDVEQIAHNIVEAFIVLGADSIRDASTLIEAEPILDALWGQENVRLLDVEAGEFGSKRRKALAERVAYRRAQVECSGCVVSAARRFVDSRNHEVGARSLTEYKPMRTLAPLSVRTPSILRPDPRRALVRRELLRA